MLVVAGGRHDRPDLDGAVPARRAALGPLDGFVEVFGLDEEVAPELFLGVGVGAIDDIGPAVPDPYGRRGGSRLHAFAAGGALRLRQGLVEGAPVGVERLLLPGVAAEVVFVVVDE